MILRSGSDTQLHKQINSNYRNIRSNPAFDAYLNGNDIPDFIKNDLNDLNEINETSNEENDSDPLLSNNSTSICDWNLQNEKLIKLWNKQININRLVHDKKSKCMQNLHSIMNFSLILISASSAVFLTLLTKTSDPLLVTIFFVISIILGYFNTLMTVINKVFDFGKYAEKHKYTSLKYLQLSLLINAQLSLNTLDRMSAKQFLDKIQGEFRELINYGPRINTNVNDLPDLVLAESIKEDDIMTNPTINIDVNIESGNRFSEHEPLISNEIRRNLEFQFARLNDED